MIRRVASIRLVMLVNQAIQVAGFLHLPCETVPGNHLKEKLWPEDMVVTESFSRLRISIEDLIELVAYFEKRQIKLLSIKEKFDTSTLQGKLMMTVFQAFSQYERVLIVQRTKGGMLKQAVAKVIVLK
jgi:DNA invertase Pin-like site-specific DNA recombinase